MKKNKTKKRRSNKAPSAKQLAARRKFALAAKARAKAAKAKKAAIRTRNPRYFVVGIDSKGREHDLAVRVAANKTQTLQWAKQTYPGYKKYNISLSDKADYIGQSGMVKARRSKGQRRLNPLGSAAYIQEAKVKNKTIISKPKRVIVLNPGAMVRRKVRNSYMDLVIRGTAEKTPQGWRVGKKVIPQGRGIATVSSGYYLDKATGTIFAKRARNVAEGFYDASGVFHPIRSSVDYDGGTAGEGGGKPRRTRSKKKRAAARKASATARHRASIKSRKATTSRLASRSLFRSVTLPRMRKINPQLSEDQIAKLPSAQRTQVQNALMGYRLAGKTVLDVRKLSTGTVEIILSDIHGQPVNIAFDKKGHIANPRAAKEKLFFVYVQSKTGNTSPFLVGKVWAVSKPSAIRLGKEVFKEDYGHDLRTVENWQAKLSPIRNGKKRNAVKASPKVRQLRETFTGTASRKTATMNASEGTPSSLAKLGKLILIKTEGGTIKPGSGTTWLCADAKGKLHLTTTAERLIDGPAQNFGEVSQIEYEASKPHLGHNRPTIFFHKMGEDGGNRPVLIADGKGGLKLRGGSYRIEREGIVN